MSIQTQNICGGNHRAIQESAAGLGGQGTQVVEIALHSQFSSQSSFTRAFRRATGMTPAEYRRTLR